MLFGQKKIKLINTPNVTKSLNTNVIESNLKGVLNINLSKLLNQMINLKFAISSDGYTELMFVTNSLKKIVFNIPSVNLAKFFNPNTFNSNFYISFQTNFPESATSDLFFGLSINIINDLPYSYASSLEIEEIRPFRLFVCLFFGLMFNINLSTCSCYPKNESELNAVNSGLGMNCVSLQCKNYLLKYPNTFDNLIHTDCPSIGVQAAFVSIKAFAGGNVNFSNLNIEQTFNCIQNNSENFQTLDNQ